jgi:hypothetical protein
MMTDPNNTLDSQVRLQSTSSNNSNSAAPENLSQVNKIAQSRTGDTGIPLIDFVLWGASVFGGIGSIFQSNGTPNEPAKTQSQPTTAAQTRSCNPNINSNILDTVSTKFKLDKNERLGFKAFIENLAAVRDKNGQIVEYKCLPKNRIEKAAEEFLYNKHFKNATGAAAETFKTLLKLKVTKEAAVIVMSGLEKFNGSVGIANLKRAADIGGELIRSGKLRNPQEVGVVLGKAGYGILEQYIEKSKKQPYDPKFSSGHIRELEVAKRLIDKGISTDVELGGKELGRSRKLNKDIKLGGDVVDHTNHKVYQVKTVWSPDKKQFWRTYEGALDQLNGTTGEILPKYRNKEYGKVIDIKVTNPKNGLYEISAQDFIEQLNGKTNPNFKNYTGTVRFTNKNGVLEVEVNQGKVVNQIQNGKVITPTYRSAIEDETNTSIAASTGNQTLVSQPAGTTNENNEIANQTAPPSSTALTGTLPGSSPTALTGKETIDQNPITVQPTSTESQEVAASNLTSAQPSTQVTTVPSSTALTGTVASSTALTDIVPSTTALTGAGSSSTALTGTTGSSPTALTGGESTTALTGGTSTTALTGGRTQEPNSQQMALS